MLLEAGAAFALSSDAHIPADVGHAYDQAVETMRAWGIGEIATFDAHNGEFEGLLRGPKGKPININGLWGLSFGNDAAAGPSNTLFFAAGINDEANGLFGTLTPSKPGAGDDQGNDGTTPGRDARTRSFPPITCLGATTPQPASVDLAFETVPRRANV